MTSGRANAKRFGLTPLAHYYLVDLTSSGCKHIPHAQDVSAFSIRLLDHWTCLHSGASILDSLQVHTVASRLYNLLQRGEMGREGREKGESNHNTISGVHWWLAVDGLD